MDHAQARATPEARLRRARRTAAGTRAASGLCGLVVVLAGVGGSPFTVAGFAILLATAAVQWLQPSRQRLALEETTASVAAVLVIGLGNPEVDVLSFLWLCAAASGVVARGGRLHWAGRALLLIGLALPVARYGLVTEHLVFAAGTVGLLLTCGRITRELSGLLDAARHDADHDRLTGALSSAALRDRLASLLAAGEPRRLLIVDLDDFGTINKTRGHAAGDEHLLQATARMRAACEPGDLLGRLGGDEFAIIARGLAGDEVLAALAPMRASVGSAEGPADGADVDTLLRAADVALRVAKRRGKAQAVRYDGETVTDDPETGARGALGRLIAGDGLHMAVQPIVDVRTGTVFAYEALARFRTRGAQSPLHWFALADEFGVRPELELAALRAAIALLPDRPAGSRLTANLSPGLLGDRRVLELLRASPVADALILEVTEETLVRDESELLVTLGPIGELGVTLAIDDVGAGYAGLGQLAALRPGLVKLDRRIIRGLDSSPHRAALVEALVAYARRTGADLVAEGVETPEELHAVEALGIHLVQGWLFGKAGEPWPVPQHGSAHQLATLF